MAAPCRGQKTSTTPEDARESAVVTQDLCEIRVNDRDILNHAGKISHEVATQLAESEYEKFHRKRLLDSEKSLSDFDKAVKQLEASKTKGGTKHGKT